MMKVFIIIRSCTKIKILIILLRRMYGNIWWFQKLDIRVGEIGVIDNEDMVNNRMLNNKNVINNSEDEKKKMV